MSINVGLVMEYIDSIGIENGLIKSALSSYKEAISIISHQDAKLIKVKDDDGIGDIFSYIVTISEDRRFDRQFKRNLQNKIHDKVHENNPEAVGLVGIILKSDKVKT